MRREYRAHRFNDANLLLIQRADAICTALRQQGYTVTVRQLFYQFVRQDWIANSQSEYKRLASIIDDARYAGLLDWNHLVDRTREMEELPHWGLAAHTGPQAAHIFIEQVMPQFRTRKWSTQPVRMEAWVEKEALIDVVKRPADSLDIPYFACRGYNSTSNAHEAAERIERYLDEVDRVVILHLGDHDPEGLDMTRDIEARFRLFLDVDGYDPDAVEVRRIALNMDQVRQYNPPPNAAKEASARFKGYEARFGGSSWELDALDPPVIDALIRAEVEAERDTTLWKEAIAAEQEGQNLLKAAVGRWEEVVEMLNA